MKQKIVMKVHMSSQKCRTKALKLVASVNGVSFVGLEGDEKEKVVVIGDGVDAVKLTNCLRKKVYDISVDSKACNFGTGSRMSCTDFNVAASFNFRGRTLHGGSKPFGFRQACSILQKSSASVLFVEPLSFSFTSHNHFWYQHHFSGFQSFHSVCNCATNASEPSFHSHLKVISGILPFLLFYLSWSKAEY
ncbi:hypothetical protein K1719_021723 [Acacia pycnantha]|nr:hypothetical protein K1719_041950 [Acacia pycnantha]KAI9107335.1 hypothetical protein K1719_021723 [Acacia pycnantha]